MSGCLSETSASGALGDSTLAAPSPTRPTGLFSRGRKSSAWTGSGAPVKPVPRLLLLAHRRGPSALTCRVVAEAGPSVAPALDLQLLQPVEHQLLGSGLWAAAVPTSLLLLLTNRLNLG